MNVRIGVNCVDTHEADTGGAGPRERAVTDAPGEDRLDRQAAALAAALGDRGSERRHRQLLSLCEQHGLSDLPDLALHATRERLAREGRRGPVEKPGAYYARVLVALLAERQVFVPTAAEAGEDAPEAVRAQIRASLGLGDEPDEVPGSGPPQGALW